MTRHPSNRLERRRSAEAKALEHLIHKRIDGKKRKKIVELKKRETQDELARYVDLCEFG